MQIYTFLFEELRPQEYWLNIILMSLSRGRTSPPVGAQTLPTNLGDGM